ncbi:MAG: phosphoesterase [Gammaproteobacteria bacterium GWE2_42_36]|nr:MAG: phosphoesterase [Gammaproteobacteria bacterium GWE2_42_36]HCU05454.1 phosphoesterase [Coxiellaceae bacterium]
MPDLTAQGAHEFWKGYDDSMIYRVISFMEAVEYWTVDGHPEIEQALDVLGKSLDGITKFELAQEDHYVNVVCHLRMARVLRILQAIDSTHPGSASRLLMYAESNSKSSNDPAGLFLRRNIIFERLRLLSRVFSQERINWVTKILEQDDEL